MALIILSFAFISNIFLGSIIIRNNPKSATHRLLALISFIISIWTIANYFSLIGHNHEFTLFWIRMVMLVTAPLGPLIYLFLSCFPSTSTKVSNRVLALIISGTFIVGIVSFTPLMFKDVSLVNGIHPTPGPGIILYGLNALIFLLLGLRNIYLKYLTSKGLVRLQMKYLFFGFFLTFSLMFITNFIFVVFLNFSELVLFGPVFILILLGFVTYAIIKHRLMDIRFVLARTVSYSLLTLIIVTFYISSIYLIGRILLPGSFDGSQIAISVILSLIVAYTLEPFKKLLEKKTDKYFFKNSYDTEILLKNISHILASNIELQILSKKVFRQLAAAFQVDNLSLLLVTSDTLLSYKKYNYLPTSLEKNSILTCRDNLVFFEDLLENNLKSIMRKSNTALLVKLETEGKLIGTLIISNKLSGDIFSDDDIKVLEILGPQLAISIQNSQRFEEIKNFSKKLQTEIKKATFELKGANKQLKELDVLKDEFVSVASHELRTPMTAIKSYLWMALNGRGGPLSPKLKFYLGRSYDSTNRLIKLVNDMLNISRIESGRLSLELNQVNLPKLVDEVVAEIASRLQELKIDLKVITPTDLPDVIADADKIKEVFINLIGNSLKFTPTGGLITISLRQQDDQIITQVADTGLGMTPAMIGNLFQKFGLIKGSYQTNQNSVQGTGLGLYICKQIINLHTGTIWANSVGLDHGSTFSFSLPISSSARLKHLQKTVQHTGDVGIIHNKI